MNQPPTDGTPGVATIGGRYQITGLISQGIMGPVYRGVDADTGQAVAIKTLKPEIVQNQPEMIERFRREDVLLQELNHPNIVRRLAAIEQDHCHYLIMEFVEGGSLRDLLERQPRLPLDQVLGTAIDLADALTRTHRIGIIHRDLKPENVLIALDGTPRLSDFGLAHSLKHSTLSRAESLVGTWVYIPPESFHGLEVDERADIWSFGVMLFEMLAGRLPFTAATPAELINQVLLEPVPSLRPLRPDLPPDLCDLVDHMLARNRDERISSVRIVGAVLEAVSRGQAGKLPFPEAEPGPRELPNHLPRQSTVFIGRERELAEIARLLQSPDGRLVTLTGPAGVGKTRLAIQAAGKMIRQYPDGIFFVDLSPLAEPKFVASQVAQALGIKETHTRSPVEDIKDQMRGKQALLLVDNFEQVIDAAPVVSDLVSGAPSLTILVTSREALHVYGEQEFPVLPLSLPSIETGEPAAALSECESVALFVHRAQASAPGFRLTAENAREVAEICIQLDGLPLAIELAAARIKVFSPRYLRNMLYDTLSALTGGPRDIAARHQTLRAAIDWSYTLLDPPEKKLFAQLSVFQGSISLEAITAVCEFDHKFDALNQLESLLNKSLLHRTEGLEGEPRFVFLKTVHQFAREQLEQSAEGDALRLRHAQFFLDLVERAEPELKGPRQEDWSNILRAEYDNLRAALGWSLTSTDASTGLRLVAALAEFWYYEGPISEGERWLEQAMTRLGQVPPGIRARVLNGAGLLAFALGRHALGKQWNRAALAIAQQLHDRSSTAWALFLLSAHATTDPGEYQEGIELCEQALSLYQEIEDKSGLAWTYNQLGELTRLVKDYPRARKAYEQSLAICRRTGNRRREAIALVNLSYVAQHQGDYRQAEAYALEGLKLLHALKLKYHSTIVLAMLAGPVAALGKAKRAARLLGASEAIFESMSVSLQPADKVEIDGYVATARQQLTPEAFEACWAEGRRLSFEQAIAYAVAADAEDESQPAG